MSLNPSLVSLRWLNQLHFTSGEEQKLFQNCLNVAEDLGLINNSWYLSRTLVFRTFKNKKFGFKGEVCII